MRSIGKRFEQFQQLIKWAADGKTFIYMHPDMVAIDMKTWKQIQKKLSPKPPITIDESNELSEPNEETENWLKELFKKRLV